MYLEDIEELAQEYLSGLEKIAVSDETAGAAYAARTRRFADAHGIKSTGLGQYTLSNTKKSIKGGLAAMTDPKMALHSRRMLKTKDVGGYVKGYGSEIGKKNPIEGKLLRGAGKLIQKFKKASIDPELLAQEYLEKVALSDATVGSAFTQRAMRNMKEDGVKTTGILGRYTADNRQRANQSVMNTVKSPAGQRYGKRISQMNTPARQVAFAKGVGQGAVASGHPVMGRVLKGVSSVAGKFVK